MDAHTTSSSSPAGPRSQSPFFIVPFRLPRTGSSDNLRSSSGPSPMPHSPLLEVIHRVEHFGESHPDWGPFRHHPHHPHESPALIGGGDHVTAARTTSTRPNVHVVPPLSNAGAGAAAYPRPLAPFSLPHLTLPPLASPSHLPRTSSSTSFDYFPFTLPSKHGDGLTTSPTPSHELIHHQPAAGAPAVYESVAAAAASASHIAPPTCAHCGASVASGRPHHHPVVPSPLHSTASHHTADLSDELASGATSKKPRPLMQVVVDTCKNCMDQLSATTARGVQRELGMPGRTPYVNFRQ